LLPLPPPKGSEGTWQSQAGGRMANASAWATALDRTPVRELLQAHQEALGRLRAELSSELQVVGSWVDDVWLLRYVLSFDGRVDAAAEAARKALEWRRNNVELIAAARSSSAPPGLSQDELRAIDAFLVSGFHGTTAFGDPIFMIRAGASNVRALMDIMSEDSVTLWMSFMSECAWQRCEAETRSRGYFVKQITLQDLAGTAFIRDSRFFRVLGQSSRMNEWLRPQLLGRMIMFNAPSWMTMAFRISSAFMSQKTLSKVWVHRARTGGDTGAACDLCPYAIQLLGGRESLPTFLGGGCSCPASGGCVGGVSNGRAVPRDASELQNHSSVLRAVRRLPPLEGATSESSFNKSGVSASGAKPRTPLPVGSGSAGRPRAEVQAPAVRHRCWDRCCRPRGRRRDAVPPLLDAPPTRT